LAPALSLTGLAAPTATLAAPFWPLAAGVDHLDRAVVAQAIFGGDAVYVALEAHKITADLVPEAEIAGEVDRLGGLGHGGVAREAGLEGGAGAEREGGGGGENEGNGGAVQGHGGQNDRPASSPAGVSPSPACRAST